MSQQNIIVIAIAVLLIGFLVYWFYWKPRQEQAGTADETLAKEDEISLDEQESSQLAATPIGAGKGYNVLAGPAVNPNTGKITVQPSTKFAI